MNKKRMKWPYVQSYGEDTSIPESMVPVTAISGGIRIHDEDLGKDLPFINEAVVYANSKYTLMDTDPAAYKATYAFDGLLTIRTGVCGDNTDFPNAPCVATLALSNTYTDGNCADKTDPNYPCLDGLTVIDYEERGLKRPYKIHVNRAQIKTMVLTDDAGTPPCYLLPGRVWESGLANAFERSVENLIAGLLEVGPNSTNVDTSVQLDRLASLGYTHEQLIDMSTQCILKWYPARPTVSPAAARPTGTRRATRDTRRRG